MYCISGDINELKNYYIYNLMEPPTINIKFIKTNALLKYYTPEIDAKSKLRYVLQENSSVKTANLEVATRRIH